MSEDALGWTVVILLAPVVIIWLAVSAIIHLTFEAYEGIRFRIELHRLDRKRRT